MKSSRIHISERANWDLEVNAFTRALGERRARGLPVYDMVQSNTTRIGLKFDSVAILSALSNPAVLSYEPDARGIVSAREAVCSWYNERSLPVRIEQLMLTASSSESYSYLLMLVCNPGDRVLVPCPSYPLLDQLARLHNVYVDRYPLVADDDWRIDLQALRDAITPSTRAIVVVSPNNPTGSVLDEQEFALLDEIACDNGLVIICDEVFAEYVYRDVSDYVRCAALEARAPTFSLGGLSKSAALAQMKLGWIVAGGDLGADVMDRLEMIADTYLSVGAPVQHAVGAMLRTSGAVRGQIVERVWTNLAAFRRIIGRQCPVSMWPVCAGWYACLRVPTLMSDEAWCELLMRNEGVYVHPGSLYGFDRPGVLVVGLLAPTDVFVAGVTALRNVVMRVCSMG